MRHGRMPCGLGGSAQGAPPPVRRLAPAPDFRRAAADLLNEPDQPYHLRNPDRRSNHEIGIAGASLQEAGGAGPHMFG